MTAAIDIIVSDPKEADLLKGAVFADGTLSEDFARSLETKSNFVLLSDAAIDLGGPGRSAVFLKYDTIAAPDFAAALISDIEAEELGLYLRVSGKNLNDELFYLVVQNFRSFLKATGVMVKGSEDELWVRISKKSPLLSERPLLRLAQLLSKRIKDEFQEVTSVGVLITQGESGSYTRIKKSAESYSKKSETLKAKVWEQRGFNFNECHVLGHCGKCSDKKLCANVRRIGRLSEEQRETEKE